MTKNKFVVVDTKKEPLAEQLEGSSKRVKASTVTRAEADEAVRRITKAKKLPEGRLVVEPKVRRWR